MLRPEGKLRVLVSVVERDRVDGLARLDERQARDDHGRDDQMHQARTVLFPALIPYPTGGPPSDTTRRPPPRRPTQLR